MPEMAKADSPGRALSWRNTCFLYELLVGNLIELEDREGEPFTLSVLLSLPALSNFSGIIPDDSRLCVNSLETYYASR